MLIIGAYALVFGLCLVHTMNVLLGVDGRYFLFNCYECM